MDIKEIVLKELKGEDVSTLTKDLTEEQQKEYSKTFLAEAAELKKKELEALDGVRKEKARVSTKTEEISAEENRKFQEKVRGEQIAKAFSKFANDFELNAEQLKQLEESFKSEDSGKVDAELIYADIKKAYVKSNPDEFIDARKNQIQMEKNAAEFVASQAGGSAGAGGQGEKIKFSPEAYEVVKQAKKEGISMTLEEAEKGLKFGNSWKKTA